MGESARGLGITVIPLWPGSGRSAKRMIVQLRTNSAAPLIMAPGILLHGPDGKPTVEAEEILRHGKALST